MVAAVVLPLLTACLCAALGICCYRAKLRQLRGGPKALMRLSNEQIHHGPSLIQDNSIFVGGVSLGER